MEYEDIERLYDDYKEKYGKNTFKHIPELFREAGEIYKKELERTGSKIDYGQSWRTRSGNYLEKLLKKILSDKLVELGLKVIQDNELIKQKLPIELESVKRNLVINYGECGMHLPDADLIIYEPNSCTIVCIISIKSSLRERIAQTGYWKFKLADSEITNHIHVFFFTTDKDRDFSLKTNMKKSRAIVEVDLDGSYVLTEEDIKESKKVKLFDKFIEDLKLILENDSKIKSLFSKKTKGPLEKFI